MNYKGKKDQTYICENCEIKFPFKGYNFNHKFCSVFCSLEFRASKKNLLWKARYESWINNEPIKIKNLRPLIRSFIIYRDGYACSVCGISKWNNKEISLWCDHIDGDATNNRPDNFRLICPNCDSQSDTFGAKNKGKGRKARGLPQYG